MKQKSLIFCEILFVSNLAGKPNKRQQIDEFLLVELSRTTYWVLLCFNRYWFFSRVYFSFDDVVDDEGQEPDDNDCSAELVGMSWWEIDDDGSQTYKSDLLESISITVQF